MVRDPSDQILDKITAVEDKLDDLALAQVGRFAVLSRQTTKAIEAGEARAVNLLRMWAVIHCILIAILIALPYVQHVLAGSQ